MPCVVSLLHPRACVCLLAGLPAWLPSPQRTSVPFVAHEGAREPGGVHTCDQRWRLSDLKREFPFVDYSEVEPAVRSILVCQVHNVQMTCCYGSYIISSYLLYPPLHVPPRQCCSWPTATCIIIAPKRLKLRLSGSARKSQKRFRDTPRFKFQAVLARTQPFLSRSVEKWGDQSRFKCSKKVNYFAIRSSTTHACTCGGGGCREKRIRCGIRLRCGTNLFPFSTTSLY
jgi:hypothetical protein